MPIRDDDNSLAIGFTPAQKENLSPAKQPVEKPSALEVADAALRKENYVTRMVYGETNPYGGDKANRSYDPMNNIGGYEDHAKWFSQANSDAEVEWIKRQIDKDRSYDDTLNRAGGWGTMAKIVAGTITPDIAIGGGIVSKAVKGGQYAKAAIAGAEAGAVSGALYGAGQNVGNTSRDGMDVVQDAGMFSIAGALLSPAFHAVGQAVRGSGKKAVIPTGDAVAVPEVNPMQERIKQTAAGIKQYAEHVQAAERQAVDNQVARQSEESAVVMGTPDGVRTPPRPQAPYVAPQVGDMDLVGAFGAQKIGFGQAGVTLANSPFTHAKLAGQKLFRDLRWRKGNLDGSYTTLQSAESEIERLGNGTAGQALDQQNKMYKEYLNSWDTPQTLQYVQSKYGKTKLTFDEFDAEAGIAMSNADRHAIREVQEVARHGRTLIESLSDEASRMGLLDTSGGLKGTAQSYFGRSYDLDKIVREPTAFRQLLVNEFQRTNPTWTIQQLEDSAQKVYEHVVNGKHSMLTNIQRVAQDGNGNLIPLGNRTKNAFSHERVLEIDDNVLEPFLDKSYSQFVRRYGNTVGTDIGLTKMIGDTTGETLHTSITAEKNAMAKQIEANAALTPAEKEAQYVKLEKDYTDTISALRNGVSLLNGTYKMTSNPSMAASTIARSMLTYNYLTKMGGAAISSLTDPVKNILTFGLAPTLKHTLPAIREEVGRIFRLPSIQDPAYHAMVEANQRIGIGLETALHTRNIEVNDLLEKSAHGNMLTRGLDYASEKMGKLNLLDALTDIQKRMTGVLANDEIMRSAIAETAGNATERELQNLRRFGIDTDMSRRISDEFKRPGNLIQNGIHLTDTRAWHDAEAAETLERALSTVTHTVVYNPSKGAKVVMPSNLFGKEMESMMTQFLSFNMGSHIQHFVPMLQKFDMATFNYMLASTIMGSVVWQIKDQIRQAGSDKEPQERSHEQAVWDSVSESGLAPLPFLMNSLASGVSRQFDIRGHLGDDDRPTIRSENFNLGSALAGPSGQLVDNALGIGSDIMGDTVDRKTISKARQLIPFNNLFYMRWLFNMGETQAQDFLGVPDRATTTITIKK